MSVAAGGLIPSNRWYGLAGPKPPWRPIIYAVTVMPFTVIYALTVSPFTVHFFRTFASSPDDGSITLLGMWPLRQVHEFFLPLFVFALEVISIQLAASVWSLGMSRRFPTMVFVLAILLVAQAFPTFSVYLDSRSTEFQTQGSQFDPAELKQAEKVKAENQRRTDENQHAREAYAANLKVWAIPYDAQVRDLEEQLGPVETSLQRLQQQYPQVEGNEWPIPVRIEYNRLWNQQKDLRDKIDAVQAERQRRLNDPALAPRDLQLLPVPNPLPKYRNVLQYMIGTAGTAEGLLSLFVALIFPTIVLAAGYVIARYSGGNGQDTTYQSPLPHLSLARELQFCSSLPESRQVAYVGQLEALATFYIHALRSARQLSQTTTTLYTGGETQIEELHVLSSLKEEVLRSTIEQTSRTSLLKVVDSLIDGHIAAP